MELVAVTNRILCVGDFQQQLRKLSDAGVSAIILREKDLDDAAYTALAEQCMDTLQDTGVPLVANMHVNTARELQIKQIQLSYPMFSELHDTLQGFDRVWVSVHSVEEAVQAAAWGADALIAGHIFVTDCKKGLEPRGTEFLQDVCGSVSIPVYAIGGINAGTLPLLEETSAAGACIMSQSMQEHLFWQETRSCEENFKNPESD